jgi:superfamily II DNA/RNA helicase
MNQPTQVQTGCIPAILAGRDVVGTAHTGSGKTAAFALPILQLLAPEPFGVFALVLTPTRYAAPRNTHASTSTSCPLCNEGMPANVGRFVFSAGS